jgi:hypothetical protein
VPCVISHVAIYIWFREARIGNAGAKSELRFSGGNFTPSPDLCKNKEPSSEAFNSFSEGGRFEHRQKLAAFDGLAPPVFPLPPNIPG